MSEIKKLCFSEIKKEYEKGVLIPEIQRDYVMGAGGSREGGEEDKLDALLNAILNAFDKKMEFDFSCIITYCKDPKTEKLEIYDGQQRLTTLMLLILFCLQKEEKADEYKSYNGWYQFKGRPVANEIISNLTEDAFSIDNIEVKDFTSYSMKNLLKKFAEKYSRIDSDYLLNRVKFDRVELGSQSEIEQFFMDLNSGVKLKKYELYKAKLVHHITTITNSLKAENSPKEELIAWPQKLDNEWLNAFRVFADFAHPAEEYEIAFIQYCFSMLTGDKNIECIYNDPSINFSEVLKECFSIMEAISKLDFSLVSKRPVKPEMVEFAWGDNSKYSDPYEYSKIYNYYNKDKRGAYWNLSFEDNEYHLYYIIKKILLNDKTSKELSDDAVIWAYIISLKWQIDYQIEFVRIIKILLNHIVSINSEAWYECQYKGQYLYYSKYNVDYIPQYYGVHRKNDNNNENKENKGKFSCVLSLINNCFRNIKEWPRTLNNKEIAKEIAAKICDRLTAQGFLDDSCWMKKIVLYRQDEFNKPDVTYIDFCNKENETNGIGIPCIPYKDEYFASKATIRWPTISGSDCIEDVYILLKCDMDKVYEIYSENSDNEKRERIEAHIKKCTVNNRFGVFDKDKCFWKNDNAYRIHDRATDSSKTYVKKGGTDNYYWAYQFDNAGNCKEV